MESTSQSPPDRIAFRIGEFARALGVSRSTIDRLIQAGEIAVCQVGAVPVIPADEATHFLRRRMRRANLDVEGSVAEVRDVPRRKGD